MDNNAHDEGTTIRGDAATLRWEQDMSGGMSTVSRSSRTVSRLIDLRDLTEPDLARWRRLASTCVETNVYFSPEFLAPTDRHFAGSDRTRIVVGERDGEWTCALPLVKRGRDPHWPRSHASTLGGFLQEFVVCGTPLLSAEDPDRAARDLVLGLRDHASTLGGAVSLCLVDPQGAAVSRVVGALEETGSATYLWRNDERAAVRFADLPDGDWDGLLSRKTRQALRRAGRRLAASHAPVVLEDVTDHPDVAARYLDVELTSWRADPSRGAIAFALRPAGREWWAEVVAGLRASGRLRALQLRAGDEVIYMSVLSVSSGRANALYDVYRQSWAELKPGALGRAMTVDHLRSTGDVDLFDTGIDPSLYPAATLFFPHRTPVVSMTCTIGGPVTDWVMRGWVGTRRLVRRAAARARLRGRE